jgi:N12 class adenine-specific DNA methylase
VVAGTEDVRPVAPASAGDASASSATASAPVDRAESTQGPSAVSGAGDTGDAREVMSRPVWRPSSQQQMAPSGTLSRVRANLAALRTLRALEAAGRPATSGEQAVLARWSGWGAVPQVFDQRRAEFGWVRDELKQLLSPAERAAAERNVLNAHYTDLGIVGEVWDAVGELGFREGLVLEPGSGLGNFIGLAPEGARMVGVELDPVSAGLSGALYPNARILNESFADTRAPDATFDLVVGNVPFGPVALNDRRHNPSGHRIHNHFLVKSLHLTKPGGLVAVLSSYYTMDAANPAARREIAGLADLVGAVRLPANAHMRAAGTKAVTDLLILRRREPGQEPSTLDWERARPVQIGEATIGVNEYFLNHPHMVLGRLSTGNGLYRADELTVEGADPDRLPRRMREALGFLALHAREEGLLHSPIERDGAVADPAALVTAAEGQTRSDGYLTTNDDGTFSIVAGGVTVPRPVPASQAGELRALLGLRDTFVELLETEAASLTDSTELDELRARLGSRYDAYAARYGPINRYTLRATGRTDPETGEDKYAKIRPKQGGFRVDPYAPAVAALEHFNAVDQTATKAAIFTQRVIAPRTPRLGADTPADALAICLDTHGEVRLGEIARLLGCGEEEARRGLGRLVFDDPDSDLLVPAAAYLSGNVRAKLAIATEAVGRDPDRYAVNVEALRGVIPPDIPPEEISARLGAAWVGAPDVQAFLRETLRDDTVRVQHNGATSWQVKGGTSSVAATDTWGTDQAPAPRLAQTLLQQRPVQVWKFVRDLDGVERRMLDLEASVLAQEKANALNERFGEWVWEDPARAQRLARDYNEQFNAIVTRSYDDAELSLPGLALSFEPRSHQVAAVARMIHEPAVGLFHEVGAGKTAEMTMGCMELRRLGLVRKPCVVVPNHMLEQFGREWAQLYPQAKLLIASSHDLRGERRREFVGRCATGDWDAVILTRGAFERIPMSRQAQKAYFDREVEAMREQIERAESEVEPIGVKRMQAQLANAEERVKAMMDGVRDPGITFEQTGIDYVVVDEAHGYKNLRTMSSIPGAAIMPGSNRASDLDMKLGYLRQRHGGRVATFATATPIANSVTEAHVMQRYLRPDLLAQARIEDFDTWAATFGETVTAMELGVSGNFRINTRFAKFRNVPELLRMWHLSADIKTADDLDLDTPEIAARAEDGKREPETVTVPATPELEMYITELASRADAVRDRVVDPTEDNMLKISSHGRAAALDMRLVGRPAPSGKIKVEVAADRIAAIHAEHRDDVYRTASSEPDPVRGSLQLVFCELGTPKPDGSWSVYGELREQLAERGVPREMVRFIHEARNDREKGELFAAARAGHVAVLVGSTEGMGVGTNVQRRAVALHHLDCPWRPADLAQRDGRIIRQGNANPEVRILRYVTEGSFDAYSWQTVARKAEFIAQVMRGRLDTREIEDIGDSALSYNEVKALATGNPLLLDQARAQADVTRLERLARGHDRSQQRLPGLIESAQARVRRLTDQRGALDDALAARQPTRADAFAMTIRARRCAERTEAKTWLLNELGSFRSQARRQMRFVGDHVELAQFALLGGLPLTARAEAVRDQPQRPVLSIYVHGILDTELTVRDADWEAGGHGLITRLENRLDDLESLVGETEARIATAHTEIEQATGQLGKPFARAAELAAAYERLDAIEAEMASEITPTQDEASDEARDEEPADPATPANHHDNHHDSQESGDTSQPPNAARLAAVSFAAPAERSLGRATSDPPTVPRPRPVLARPAVQQRGGLER